MKILHICFSSAWGGLEKYSVNLALELKKRGNNVHYICRKNSRMEKELGLAEVASSSFSYIKYIDIPLMFRLHRFISAGGWEVLHAHESKDLGTIIPALWGLPEVKLFFSLHMIVPAPKKDIYHRLQYSCVKKIFALGAEGERSAKENLPITKEQVMELPYGMEIERYHSDRSTDLRKKLGFDESTKLLGILSRIEPLKGQMEAVMALPKVLRKYPTAHLLIVGEETEHLVGKIIPELKRKAEELGVSDKVTFLGYQENVPEVLNAFDIFLLPSHFESYSISVIEAKLCGIPVVGAESGGVLQNLGYGEYGILVRPKNAGSLADGIIKTLNDPKAASMRSKKAKENAITRYNKEKILDIIEEEYKS